MIASALCALVTGVAGTVLFEENFDTFDEKKWVKSAWKEDMGEWKHTAGEWGTGNKGLQTDSDMRHHAISAKLDKSFSNKDKDLVVQFTVKHEKKEYSFCGGGYIKLLKEGADLSKFGGDTDYAVMFGPDLCGYDISRIHAIFNNKGENLLKTDEVKLDYDEKDEYTHVYRLVVKNQDVQIFFDEKEKFSGKIYDAWAIPAPTHDDPTDKKPESWEDEEEIDDPEDKKPAGYDDIPEFINDPDASKPEEWDVEEDGDWEPPQIKNPEFKGEWAAKRIPNPKYKGVWKPKQVPNPDYEKETVFGPISAVGFELWTVNNGSIFDNILITDDVATAEKAAAAIIEANKGEKDAKEAFKKAKEEKEAAEKPKEEEKEASDDEEENL